MKLRKYKNNYVLFVYILQGKMGKTEKTPKEYHATKVTEIPKTKWQKYGMNKTMIQRSATLFELFMKQFYEFNNFLFSDATSRWAGWALAHLEFGSLVNPITTRGGRLCPTHYY